MFSNYRFVEPRSDKSVRIGKLSYLFAGFLGPAYVLYKSGPRKLPQSLAWSIGCAFGTFAFVVKVLPYVPDTLRIVVLILGVPAVFLLHSAKTVGLVRSSLLQRKWVSRPAY
jgi:hypothetical protein